MFFLLSIAFAGLLHCVENNTTELQIVESKLPKQQSLTKYHLLRESKSFALLFDQLDAAAATEEMLQSNSKNEEPMLVFVTKMNNLLGQNEAIFDRLMQANIEGVPLNWKVSINRLKTYKNATLEVWLSTTLRLFYALVNLLEQEPTNCPLDFPSDNRALPFIEHGLYGAIELFQEQSKTDDLTWHSQKAREAALQQHLNKVIASRSFPTCSLPTKIEHHLAKSTWQEIIAEKKVAFNELLVARYLDFLLWQLENKNEI